MWRRCTGSHISNICWIFFCKIYGMALDGWDCMRIAKQLMDDKVPIIRVKSNTECDVNYYSWGSARISYILRNPFYKGAHLVCRTHQKGIRSNTYDIIPREEWEVIEGCHEAIVTPEEWEQVQEVRIVYNFVGEIPEIAT